MLEVSLVPKDELVKLIGKHFELVGVDLGSFLLFIDPIAEVVMVLVRNVNVFQEHAQHGVGFSQHVFVWPSMGWRRNIEGFARHGRETREWRNTRTVASISWSFLVGRPGLGANGELVIQVRCCRHRT